MTVEQQQRSRLAGTLRPFVALQHRNYRLFWSGQAISLIGTWLQATGTLWLVWEMTHSAWLMGVAGAIEFTPGILFLLFAGVLADTVSRRSIIVWTQSCLALQALLLCTLVVTGTARLWHVFLLVFFLGVVSALDAPARRAFVAEMVGRDDLPNAIALNTTLFNVARVVGPALSGLLIPWLGIGILFLINALSFIPVIIGLALMRTDQLYRQTQQGVRKQGMWRNLGEAFLYIVKAPILLLLFGVIGIVALFGINMGVLLPLFADHVLHTGSEGYGIFLSAQGLGGVAATLVIGVGLKKRFGVPLPLLGAMAFTVAEILFALSQFYWISLVLIVVVGFTQVIFLTAGETIIQSVIPDQMRGRIMSTYTLILVGSNPPGYLLIGKLATLVGPAIALLLGAGLSLLAAFFGWIMRGPATKDAAKRLEKEHVS